MALIRDVCSVTAGSIIWYGLPHWFLYYSNHFFASIDKCIISLRDLSFLYWRGSTLQWLFPRKQRQRGVLKTKNVDCNEFLIRVKGDLKRKFSLAQMIGTIE